MKLDGTSGVETLNGRCSHYENQLANTFASGVGLPCLGGNDVHAVEDLGKYVTIFPDGIDGAEDFIDAVKMDLFFLYYMILKKEDLRRLHSIAHCSSMQVLQYISENRLVY